MTYTLRHSLAAGGGVSWAEPRKTILFSDAPRAHAWRCVGKSPRDVSESPLGRWGSKSYR